MRRLLGHKLKPFIFGIILALAIAAVPAGKVFACTDASPCKPYFKVFGSDVFSGGWFTSSGICDTSLGSYYQDGLSNAKYGGIMAFTKLSGSQPVGGASSQFGAFSLGSIDGDNVSHGLYSNGANSGTVSSPSILSFANDNNSPWGGKFQGSIRQAHCIPDYYAKKPNIPDNLTTSLPATPATGVYSASGTGSHNSIPFVLTNASVTISTSRQITIFVNGPVYIGNNITYQAGYNETNVPKFVLVSKGSIYIDPTVTQLDGLYIAQPGYCGPLGCSPVTADTGVIWSCHDNSATPITAAYIYSNCGNRLIVNGALIAKRVNLTRILGDRATPCSPVSNEESPATAVAFCASKIAEIINFTPAMVVGGGFFNPSSNASLNIESLVSLPPTL